MATFHFNLVSPEAVMFSGEVEHAELAFRARHDDVLQSRIQTFGVLAHDDEIELRIAARHVWQRAHRTQVGVKIECFSEAVVYVIL